MLRHGRAHASRAASPRSRTRLAHGRRAPVAAALLMVLLISGCRTVPQEELDGALAEVERLSGRLAERERRIDELEGELASLEASLDAAEVESAALRDDLDLALRRVGQLREERFTMQEEITELSAEVDRLRRAGERLAQPGPAEEAVPISPPDARATALGGGGGFTRVPNVGFRNDPRAASRLSAAAPGIGVDTEAGVPVLYDSRVDYEATAIYLAIVDPESRSPRLRITTQFTTDDEPIYLSSALVTIEGSDPIDPIDPIVLSGEAVRETDGELLREALLLDADRTLIDRLTNMVSSNRFQVTFVGLDERLTHRPTVAERAAMANILFAFIDLGGVR